jgi:hypothetical protein
MQSTGGVPGEPGFPEDIEIYKLFYKNKNIL